MELSSRRPGPDVVRALALIGVVVMNYHGYLIQRGATSVGDWKYDLFEPWTGPLSTRFAATFVLVAGVGVTLMTKSARGDRLKTAELRLVLLSRGALLYVVGIVFNQMWPGSILPYYGVLFACAAGLFTLRSRTICAIGAAAVLAAWAIQWWAYDTRLDGGDTTWLFNPPKWSPSDLVFGMFVNGTHPILPWLAFFCLGIVVGRQIGKPNWRVPVLAVGAGLFTASALIDRLVSGARADTLFNNNPFDRGVVYVASALGTALVAFAAIGWLADRYAESRPVDALQRAGQMSLTLYLLHAFVFEFAVDQFALVEPAGLGRTLTFAGIYWVIALAGAVAWSRAYGRGPAEQVYRALTSWPKVLFRPGERTAST